MTDKYQNAIFFFVNFTAEKNGYGCWYKCERQQHGRRQGQHDGDCHWLEHFSFNTGECENRQINGRNNAQTK